MTLILAAGSLLDQPAEVMLDAAAAAGFDGVGVRVAPDHPRAGMVALAEQAATRGGRVHDLEVHRITTDRPDPGPLVELAAAGGAAAVLVVSDVADRATTVAEVARLVELASVHGLSVGLEYMAWTDPSDPLTAIEIARETGCRVVVDVLHHVRVGAGPAELAAVAASGTLGWVQLCDAPSTPPHDGDLVHEARHARLVPGAGGLPLAALVAEIPGDTTVSVEVQSDALLTVGPTARATLLHDAARSVLAGA